MSEKAYGSPDEIRQLVEGFYDIQHLRLESWNRIVAYVKEHAEDLKNLLVKMDKRQDKLVTQEHHASQSQNETHSISASQSKCDTHIKNASHTSPETQAAHASILLDEKKYSEFAKRFVLSQWLIETQKAGVSHAMHESHSSVANRSLQPKGRRKGRMSHLKFETQCNHASQNLFADQYFNALSDHG